MGTNSKREQVEIGLVRYDTFDYKKLSTSPLIMTSESPVLHMAAVIPAPEFRDKFVIVEKCWTNREVLFDNFGCQDSEFGYVYTNGAPDASPRFSLRIPNWTIEFMCDVIYCETECEVTCGNKKKKRFGRDAEKDDGSDLSTTPQPQFQDLEV